MPLNFKGVDPDRESNDHEEGPVLHQPAEASNTSSKLMIILGLVVIVLAAVFLIYKYGFQKEQEHGPATPMLSQSIDTMKAPPAQTNIETQSSSTVPPQDNVVSPPQPATEKKNAVSEYSGDGRYTIYIARHKTQSMADEEAGRWKDAGYLANVYLIDEWYCVSIGRFKTRAEARETAEKLNDGFEAGYRVGTIAE